MESVASRGRRDTEFVGISLTVLPGVFPSKRDTQMLTRHIDLSQAKRILDMGTGSGALAIWAATHSDADVVAFDIAEAAYENAVLNVRRLGLTGRISVRLGDIESCIKPDERFDIIIANLPGRKQKGAR